MSTTLAPVKFRKPTGKPSWPILLLAGAEKTGKSYNAAVAASSPLVGRTYWVSIGEDDPDEYGQLGDFDIVEHDGTYRGILTAIQAVARQPRPEHGVPLLVVDSMTRLWDQLKDQAQATANSRANRKGNASSNYDAQITTDLWNAAASQWQHVMDAIRAFPGPVILTSRLDIVAVMDEKGQPTKERMNKVQAHKSLPYDVGAVVEMPQRGEMWLTGVRSVRLKLKERTRKPNFTVDGFWRELGLAEAETAARTHSTIARPEAETPPPAASKPDPNVYVDMAGQASDLETWRNVWRDAKKAGVLEHLTRDDISVEEALLARGEMLKADAAHAAAEAPDPAPADYDPSELV